MALGSEHEDPDNNCGRNCGDPLFSSRLVFIASDQDCPCPSSRRTMRQRTSSRLTLRRVPPEQSRLVALWLAGFAELHGPSFGKRGRMPFCLEKDRSRQLGGGTKSIPPKPKRRTSNGDQLPLSEGVSSSSGATNDVAQGLARTRPQSDYLGAFEGMEDEPTTRRRVCSLALETLSVDVGLI